MKRRETRHWHSIKAREKRRTDKKNVVEANGNEDGGIDGGNLPNGIEKGRARKREKNTGALQ